MEFTVSKADFLRELSFTQGVIEKKTTIPILANLLIEAAEGQIRLTATDLELGVQCSCKAGIETPGAGTLPAKRLLDFVRLLPDQEIKFKFLENHWVSITCGRSRTRMAGLAKESYPELPVAPVETLPVPSMALRQMISRTMFAISAEESRFTLNGALLVLDPASLKMVATDGHRLAHVMTSAPIEGLETTQSALLPRKAMGEILKLAEAAGEDAQIRFAADDNHLFFSAADRLLITRKLTGSFPDYERVLPKEQKHEIVLLKDDIRSGLERVAQFSDERSRAVKLKFEDGELKIYSSLSDTGESEESIPVDYAGDTADIGFNAQYILEFLRAVPDEHVRFCFRDAQSAAEFQPGAAVDETHSYRYVVMPMRI
ncbi:MAG: DNA polymerase III subunit beta [Bryobacterales bacterium]|nr:DNA polymerase III subunit beta [Bryobacterales bacterium]